MQTEIDISPRSTVVDHAIDALRDAIVAGRLAPGQRLVISDVTAMLGVSAGPVREAVRRLTGEGLIEVVPHRGALVRSITEDDLREVFELREAVEASAARLAAANGRTPAYLAKLGGIMATMDEVAANEDVEGYLENNRAFHDLIYQMSGNGRLRTYAHQLAAPIYQLRLPHRMGKKAIAISYSQHQAITTAIVAGNEDQAERAMRLHIAYSGAGLLHAFKEMSQSSARPLRRAVGA